MARNKAATEMGRKGGLARAEALSQEERSAIASHAALVRWAKKKGQPLPKPPKPTPLSHDSRRKRQLLKDLGLLFGGAVSLANEMAELGDPDGAIEHVGACKEARGRLEAFLREAEVPARKVGK